MRTQVKALYVLAGAGGVAAGAGVELVEAEALSESFFAAALYESLR